MIQMLRTAVAGVGAVGITGALSPVVSALTFVDETAPDATLHVWAKSVLAVAGVRTQAVGLEHLPQGNFVLALNHQSHFDTLVLFANIRRHMRFVAKRELFKIPVFGMAMRRAGNVMVDRQGGDDDRQRLNDAIEAVQKRVSIVFFAEGTRSADGVLRPFKKGAAMLALQAQVPIVPAAVAGTYTILPKGQLAIRPSPAALVIGQPIETTGLTIDDRDRVTEQLHQQVSGLLAHGNELVAQMG